MDEIKQTPVWVKKFVDSGENKADQLANRWLEKARQDDNFEIVLDFELAVDQRGVTTILCVYTAKVEL